MDPAVRLSMVSDGTEWATADTHAARCATSPAAVVWRLQAIGADERERADPDHLGRPVTEYRSTGRVSPGRAAELIVGALWREVREGGRRGGHTASGEAWMEVRGMSWLRAIDATAAGLVVRWRGHDAYLSVVDGWDDPDDAPTSAVDLLDYLAGWER